jgi:hypothetical protein
MGQAPGLSEITSGCIGQVYLAADATVALLFGSGPLCGHEWCWVSADGVSAFIQISLFQEAGEHPVELIDQFRWLHRVSFWMLGILADHTGMEMAGEKFQSERIERGTDGRNLVQDIHAIPILFDHPLDSSDLSGDAISSPPDTLAGV